MLSSDSAIVLPMFGSIDCKLASIHRELKFIARTLARLRHRHHAALVFSSKRSSQQTYLVDLQRKLSQNYDEMLRKLLGTNAKPEDIESCPSTPVDQIAPPLCLTPGYRTPCPSLSPTPLSPPLADAPSHRKKPSLRRSSHLDTVTVIADEQSQAVFDIPRQHLSELLETQDPETVVVHDRDTEAAKSVTGIFIRKVDFASFYDFVQWTKNSRILQYPHDNAEWLVEHHARRLVDALALGVNIKSTEYQCAAVSELHTLGPLLTWPEDLVNIIFAATSAYSPGDHPARQLIVAIVAAKTCGAGKRKARQGARDRNVERGDRISSTTFWKMYDAYCMEQGPECPYPERS